MIQVAKPGVRFRPLTASDLSIYAALYSDPESMAFVAPALDPVRTEKSFRAALRQTAALAPGLGLYLAMDADTGDMLGLCGASPSVPRLGSVEVGVMLLPGARGKGWSTVVMAAWIRSIFEQHDVDQVWLRYDRNHLAVARFTSRLDFILTDDVCFAGRWCHSAQLSRAAWSESWGSIKEE